MADSDPRASEIFHAAMEQKPADRAAFIREAAGGDEALRREVESLVAYESGAAGFLEPPAEETRTTAPAPGSLIGRRVGQYEVLALVGAGGMGEVYRAQDHTLGRAVALKILPQAVARDPDRVARFEREARALAALNHPHIAQVYGLETSGDLRAIAMELVDGPTLADILERGRRLPIRDTLKIARQIADALEAAHEAGIVHRDLKPANIKVRDDGIVKVLDFGLARAGSESDSGVRGSDAGGSASTVLSPAITAAGVILGTAAYMAPEQAQGRTVDRRADAWAFGVVLYEMLTGKRAFAGGSIAEVLSAVVNQPVSLDDLPADTPETIRRLLRRCLERDRRERLGDLGTARLDIDEILAAGSTTAVGTGPVAQTVSRKPVLIAAAAAVGVVIAAISFWPRSPATDERPLTVEVRPPADQIFTNIYAAVAVSPDGHSVVFGAGTGIGATAKRGLWLRPLDGTEARFLEGTEDANYPVWSPDGRAIAFTQSQRLMRIDLGGGVPRTLVESNVAGPAWSKRGYLILNRGGLIRVPEGGGDPVQLTKVDRARKERAHTSPHILPDERVLFFIVSDDPEVQGVYVLDLDVPGPPRRVLKSSSKATYMPGPDPARGHLLWTDKRSLVAQPFRLDGLALEGSPATIATEVAVIPERSAFWTSPAGTIAYFLGDDLGSKKLRWFDRSGRLLGEAAPEGFYRTLRLSHDNTRLAVTRTIDGHVGVWIRDLSRGDWTHISTDPVDISGPFWSPGDQDVAFSVGQRFQQRASTGFGDVRRVTPWPEARYVVLDWSADGQLTLGQPVGSGRTDLYVRGVSKDSEPAVVSATSATETHPRFSPDGKWVAYASDESTRFEVYVQATSGARQRWPVSIDGGHAPRWRRDGSEIFFVGLDNKTLYSATTRIRPGKIEVSRPTKMFEMPIAMMSGIAGAYDVTSDGQRFIALIGEDQGPPVLTVHLNWRSRLPR